MKIKTGFVLTELNNDYVAVPVGETSADFHGVVKLNSSGKIVWDAFAEGLDEEAAADRLVEIYDIDRETALADVHAVAEILKSKSLLEDQDK